MGGEGGDGNGGGGKHNTIKVIMPALRILCVCVQHFPMEITRRVKKTLDY